MNNLSQFAKSTESYVSDYSDYYPCHAAYGYPTYLGANPAGWANTGVVADKKLNEAADTCQINPGLVARLGTILYGRNQTAGLRGAKNHLQAPAAGLGYLLTTGYLADARAFYCPSTQVTVDIMQQRYEIRAGMALEPRDLTTLGGSDANSLVYGDYAGLGASKKTDVSWYTAYNGNSDAGVWCPYNYRNMALTTQNDPVNGGAGTKYTVRFTKPRLIQMAGVPSFKTMKQLGGRSLVADTFTRAYSDFANTRPGLPIYAHKEGVNVLYGDYHTAWYGDPQGRIAWQDMTRPAGHTTYANQWDGSDYPVNRPYQTWFGFGSVWNVLHDFDVAAGMDVGATTSWND
jgi:hypothetical protein